METRHGRNVLNTLRVGFAGAVAWAFFTWVVDDARLFLDYVKVLVWPVALLCIAVLFRDVLGEKFRQLARLDVPGARVDFRESAARALGDSLHEELDTLSGLPAGGSATDEDDAREAATLNGAQIVEHPAASVAPAEDHPEESSPTTAPPQVVQARELQRDSVESIIQKSADWGYRLGRSGSPQAVPDVEWSSDGSWRITTDIPRHQTRPEVPPSSANDFRSIHELEKEIKAIEKRKHSVFGVSAIASMQDQGWLAELKRRLYGLDPGNPWAD